MWAVACILCELLTGNLLFPTHDNLEHLAMMDSVTSTRVPACLAMPLDPATVTGNNESERKIAEKWALRHNEECKKYCEDGRIKWPQDATQKSLERVKRLPKLEQVTEDPDLLDLLKKLLDFDPKTRLTAAACLQHRFFASVAADYPS